MLDQELAAGVPSWSSISTELLQAELRRRNEDEERPQCASANISDYNVPIHVVALVIILVVSTLGCGFPLLSMRASKKACTHTIVFYSQHFGTGVLIATAFVHLVPTAFLSLTDKCLPWFFNEGYSPLAGVISMVAVLIVVGIEMFMRTRGVLHSHSHNPDDWEEPAAQSGLAADSARAGREGDGPWPAEPPSERPSPNEEDKVHEAYVRGSQDSDISMEELDRQQRALSGHAGTQTSHITLTPEEEQKKKMLQCLLLEAGILFHSVFIGMALSVATGTPFIVLLVAISFHQLFEGMALGSRIAAIKFPRRSLKPWFMVCAYGLTTPIGQAIGLGVHTLYHPESQAGLLMVGIMNAISAGLLLFAGLVQLLAEDFLSDNSYGILQGQRRVKAYVAVVLGAVLMALVGAWA